MTPLLSCGSPDSPSMYFRIPSLDTVRTENFKVRYKQGLLVISVLWPQSMKRDINIGPFREALDSQSLTVSRKGEQVVVSMAKQRKAKWDELTKTVGEYSSVKHEGNNRAVTPGKQKPEPKKPETSQKKSQAPPLQQATAALPAREAMLSPKSPQAAFKAGLKSSRAYLETDKPSLEASPARESSRSPVKLKSGSPVRRLSLDKESSALRLSKNIRLLNEKEKPNYRSGSGIGTVIARKSIEDLVPIKKTEPKTEKKALLKQHSSIRNALNKKALPAKPHSASPLQQRAPSLATRTPPKEPKQSLASKTSAKKLPASPKQAKAKDSSAQQNSTGAPSSSSSRPNRKLPNPETSTDQSSEKDWFSRLGSILPAASLKPIEGYFSMPLEKKLALQREIVQSLAQIFKEELVRRYECEKRFERVLLGDSRRIGELEKKLETRKGK